MAAFLTGAQPRKTDGTDIRVGISVDQVAASRIGDHTRLGLARNRLRPERPGRQLRFRLQLCVYSSTISWRSATTPVPKLNNPRLIFDRLFSTGPDADRARRERNQPQHPRFRPRRRQQPCRPNLGGNDRRSLDEYLASIRDIEQRIERAARLPEPPRPNMAQPTGIPTNYQEHLRLLCDLLVLAFQADITRVSTLVFANEGSNSAYPFIDVREGHHDLSHHGNDAAKQAQDRNRSTASTSRSSRTCWAA